MYRVHVYYWNKVTVHHLKLCYFLMKKDNTMICGVLLNHCLTVNRIISKSVWLDTRLRDTSLKRCGVKSQFTNSVSCVSIIGVDASLTTTTHASTTTTHASTTTHQGFLTMFVLITCRTHFSQPINHFMERKLLFSASTMTCYLPRMMEKSLH